jgi:hypothetical protein
MDWNDPEQVRAYQREWARRKRAANPEHYRAAATASRAANPEKAREQLRRWRAANRERKRELDRRQYAKDIEKSRARVLARKKRDAATLAKRAEERRLWRQRNPGKARAMSLRSRFAKEQRTPSWANIDEINRIYLACPHGMHVDHIVPLRGITVDGYKISGLHVPWNLQYLTPFENKSKNNRMRQEDTIIDPTYFTGWPRRARKPSP